MIGVHLHDHAASSRPVAIANRMEARTASKFGVQLWSSEGDFPPRKKDMLLRWVLVHCSISVRCAVHF